MVDYKALYHIMVDGTEKAISAIEAHNYGKAKELLIRAEQEAEERYIEMDESDGEAE